MLQKIFNAIIGDPNEKELKKIAPMVDDINRLELEYQSLSKEQLKAKTPEFKERLAKGETLDQLLPEAFAVVKNACRRLVGTTYPFQGEEATWDMIPYDVQLLGGIVLHQGKVAEMKTGEGKTLVCTMPIYLNALSGKGVHLVTVNDYLAKRDAEWMGHIYRFLGLNVGVIVHGLNNDERRAAYAADITYGTNNEFGFDYLRDNMAQDQADLVQRGLSFAIVDEVDSILIDEARTPLIISAPAEESTDRYRKYSQLIPRLVENEDYNVDEKMKAATLTEEGIEKMEGFLGMKNIYTEGGIAEVHHIEQALKAHALFKKDIDYVVKDDEIMIVDEFTGRLMPGRRYSDGLHQAIEAKEAVDIKRESKTLASISFQNYFRLYDKLAGMTGTAITEAEEFAKIYELETMVMPTNQAVIRQDMADRVYKNTRGKFMAAVQEIKERHEKGQPVLVGTIAIETSETLSNLLKKEGVPHRVLNAKHHEKEAEIVAKAGELGAVTIATNMAGRGTDIKLGEDVRELGGLHILGTERHESRRIDNQLRGRSGRQGDPGSSQFYVSLEDDIMRLFGSDRVRKMMDIMGIPDNQPIENRMVSRSIESAQTRVEGRNFDIRKHLVEYDDVMNKQRESIYKKRREILKAEDISAEVQRVIEQELEVVVSGHFDEHNKLDSKEVAETLRTISPLGEKKEQEILALEDSQEIISQIQQAYRQLYQDREAELPDPTMMRKVERIVYLRTIDVLWMEHLNDMQNLRDAVSLRGYGQRDPLIEYKREGFFLFEKLLGKIQTQFVSTIFKVRIQATPGAQVVKQAVPQQIQTEHAELSGLSKAPQAALKKQGTVKVEKHIGRNDPCPCGSGKKYKKCCGK
ncbi:MAG: preprotein translocase subunit SecA [Candidatus Gracilibacteria bacterium]|nr:preprotein translocase subunit SecA [Candidatus Gracilibacteria bacterium]